MSSSRLPTLQLIDMKILALHSFQLHNTGFSVEVYNLSKSGQRYFKPVTEQLDQGHRGVLLTSNWTAQCQTEGFPDNVHLMGNKLV